VYAEERQQAIADLVAQRGRLSVNALAAQYDVTTETVRRDLSVLERAGVLRRVHGGAVPAAALTALESKVGDRDLAHADQKDRIARRAVGLLPPSGGSVLLDAGTTTARLAMLVPRGLLLTVVTNAVPIAARLAGSASVDLHLLPGRVRPTTHAAVGEDTVAALGRLRADVAFIGTNGLSVGHGLSTPDHAEAAAKHAMVTGAHRVVALVDSSKIGQEHTVRFAELADIDVVVTDNGIDPADLRALRDRGVEVLVA
jgi:DeoR family transcriptional regulator, fructose operon transcriptional repressor